jgi:hypothetical protein
MTQGVLPFKYEEEKKEFGLTSFGGLFVYFDLFRKLNLKNIVNRHLKAKAEKQGWSDYQQVLSLLLLNLCGCESVDDIEYLESDSGLRRLLKNLDLQGAWGRHREDQKRRWRQACHRSLPASSSIFRYLDFFHNESEEKRREAEIGQRNEEIKSGKEKHGKAFIPVANDYLCGLSNINQELLNFLQLNSPETTATLDMDATIIDSNKSSAFCSYKGPKGYQPLNTWWAEQKALLHTEFRDGNVPAGHQQMRVLSEALDCLPAGIDKVYLRSDSAGYQWELFNYCAKGQNKRFGRIEFAISCDITKEFKDEVLRVPEDEWQSIYKKVKGKLVEISQWAEVPFVPQAEARSKKGPEYRFIAVREVVKQRQLPGMESLVELPFPNFSANDVRYKLSGLITNMAWEGESLIHWLHKRCGDSEHIHSEMKKAYCGGRFPSGKFGVNAAWWWFMVLAINVTAIFKKVVLNKEWRQKRMKGLSLFFIRLAGRVIKKGREIIIRLSKGEPVFPALVDARKNIMSLSCLPSG